MKANIKTIKQPNKKNQIIMSEVEVLAVLQDQMRGMKWLMRTLLGVVISLIGTIIWITWEVSPQVRDISMNKHEIKVLANKVNINEEGVYIMMDAFINAHHEAENPKHTWNEYAYRQIHLRSAKDNE